MSEGPTKPQERCPRCGAALSARPEGRLCARCLLALAIEEIPTPPGAMPAAQLAASATLVIGKDVPEWIGSYHLLSVLGSGGMGVVFLAEQEQPLKRRVALKLVKRGMDSKEVLARFETERQALALMSHPGIAKVFDAGTSEDGLPYFVMEHVAGIPITEYCDRNRLSSRQRLELFVEVCEAVQHAHTKGIIHRDIKPSNVLVSVQDSRPQPKVIDFGVAKAVSQRLTEKTLFTQLGVMIGTPGYMSPEQAEVTGLDVDTRSDIYSLGVLAYELLVGELPFDPRRLRQAAWRELQQIIQEEEPPKPSARLTTLGATATDAAVKRGTDPLTLARELRGDLDWITLKALEKDRTRRYQTASELAADVRRHFRDEPVTAGPPGLGYRLTKAIHRHKLLFGAGVSIAAALVLGLVAATTQYVKAEAAGRETRRLLYVAHMTLTGEYWDSANIPAMQQLLDEHRPGPRREDNRGFEWFYYWKLSHGDLRTLPQPALATAVAFSPDGSTLATAGAVEHGVTQWDVASGQKRRTLPGQRAKGTALAFSRDGRTLATGGEGPTATLWDVESSRQIAILSGHTLTVDTATFSPDGSTVATGGADRWVRLWATSNGHERVTLGPYPDRVTSLAFSPDGRLLAVGTTLGRVTLSDTSRGSEIASFAATPVYDVAALAFSPDGRRLAAGGLYTGALVVWDVRTRKELVRPRGHKGAVMSVAFFPDGGRIVTGSYDRTALVWDVASGGSLQRIQGHGDSVDVVALSPDGKTLATSSRDGTVKLWDAEQAQTRPLVHRRSFVKSLAVSPDGRWLATAALGFEDRLWAIRLWDASTGKEVATLAEGESRGVSVAFSADGQHLAAASHDAVVRFWDTDTRHPVESLTLRAPLAMPTAEPDLNNLINWEQLAFSLDGYWLASAVGNNTVQLWDLSRRQAVATLEGHTGMITNLGFSPSGKQIATSSADGTARLWDPSTGRETRRLAGHDDAVTSVAFSPDGRRLATGGVDRTIRVWDMSNGAPLGVLKGRAGEVWSLAFAPDGRRLAVAGGSDHSIRLWDLTTGLEVASLGGHVAPVNVVAFFPDGRTLASAGNDTFVRLRRAAAQEEVSARDAE